ncbi:MAG: hypothetical protein ABFS34_11500, partial [Gemmatimonadota bacterium]
MPIHSWAPARGRGPFAVALTLAAGLASPAGGAHAQSFSDPGEDKGATENVEVLAHIQLNPPDTRSVSDIELEQDLDRPFAYVGRRLVHGFDVIDLSDPGSASVLYEWRIEDAELHTGNGP